MAALAATALLAAVAATAQPAARSGDGRWQLQAAPPASLRLLDENAVLVRSWPAASRDGRTVSEVASVHDNVARRSFLVAFTTLPEFWEISYDPAAEPIFDGLVHDYRMGEGLARSGFLGARRTPLDEPLAVLAIAGGGRLVLGLRTGPPAALEAVHLDVRRRIASTPLGVRPTAATSALFVREGRELLALGGTDGGLQVVDPEAGRVLRTLAFRAVRSVQAEAGGTHLAIGLFDKRTVRLDARTLEPDGPEGVQAPPAR